MHNYRMRRIWPSMCHKLLGNGTWYVLLATVWLHLWAAATGSMRLRVSRTLLLGTTIPSACRYALIIWMELIIQHKIKYILYLKIDKTYRGICSMLTSEPDLGNWLWSLLTCSSRLASLMRVNLFLAEIWKDLIFLCRYEEEQPNILAMALTVKPWVRSSSSCPLVMSSTGLPRLPKTWNKISNKVSQYSYWST